MEIIGNKIIADDGMTLTNGETYCKTAYLARDATADGWWEVTDAEAEAAMTEVDPETALAELTEVLA